MKYCIPDLSNEDHKAVGDIIFNPDNDITKVEVKSYTLPSGKKLKVTYTTTRTNFEVVDDWVDGNLSELDPTDYDYVKNSVLFQPSENGVNVFTLPSGKKIKIS